MSLKYWYYSIQCSSVVQGPSYPQRARVAGNCSSMSPAFSSCPFLLVRRDVQSTACLTFLLKLECREFDSHVRPERRALGVPRNATCVEENMGSLFSERARLPIKCES